MTDYRVPNLDVLHWQGAVKDKDLNTPPGSPVKGDRYIVGLSPTGAWVGHTKQITYYSGSAWVFLTLKEGLVAWVEDEDKIYAYNGTAWAEVGGGGGGLGYALSLTAANLVSMADAPAIYIFGNTAGLVPQTAYGTARVYIPKAGTIKSVVIRAHCATPGSDENVSVYIRNITTDTLVAAQPMNSNTPVWYNAGLNIAVNLWDYFEIKIICPTWVTNPANVRFSGAVYIE